MKFGQILMQFVQFFIQVGEIFMTVGKIFMQVGQIFHDRQTNFHESQKIFYEGRTNFHASLQSRILHTTALGVSGFYRWREAAGVFLVVVWQTSQTTTNNAPTASLQR